MVLEGIRKDLLELMKIINERGGMHCTGMCHHRKPGEFHCHQIGQMLNISSTGVKRRILDLQRAGYIEHSKIEREGSIPLHEYTLSLKGQRALSLSYDKNPSEERDSP